MSQNPEVKLARNTELASMTCYLYLTYHWLAFTEAHLTYLNRKIVQ